MSDPTGPDLARQALAAWKATAKTRPATGATKPRKKRAQYGDARDPVGLGAVLKQLGAEQEWKTGVAGGNIVDQWPTLCPELVGKVQPISLDTAGCLTVQPASPTYATHLRVLGPQLVSRLQAKGVPVRRLRPLRPGHVAAPAPEPADRPQPPIELGPEKTRETASAGYLAALSAHQAHVAARPSTEIQQLVEAAAAAQGQALRAHREAPEAHRDAVWFTADLEDQDAAEREQIRQAAIRRARDEKAGRVPALPTVFQQTA
jgi:hypothetical protein